MRAQQRHLRGPLSESSPSFTLNRYCSRPCSGTRFCSITHSDISHIWRAHAGPQSTVRSSVGHCHSGGAVYCWNSVATEAKVQLVAPAVPVPHLPYSLPHTLTNAFKKTTTTSCISQRVNYPAVTHGLFQNKYLTTWNDASKSFQTSLSS